MNKCPQCGGRLNNDEIASHVCFYCGCQLDSQELTKIDIKSMSENNVKFSSGTIIWLSIGIIGNLWSANINLSNGVIQFVIICLLRSGLNIWFLIGKRKLTFYLIVIEVIIEALLVTYLYKIVLFPFLSLLNPVITYLFISKQWDKMK